MKRIATILILLLFAFSATAQELNIFGYFESQLTMAALHDDMAQLHSNKLRLDLKTDFGRLVTFTGNYNIITYHGTTHWDFLDFLPDTMVQNIPQQNYDNYIFDYTDRYYLDNAFARISLRYADITVGKQQMSFGTGYAWNPTDLFDTKDILDPTYEQPGHNALRVDIPFAQRIMFSTVYEPEDTWDLSGKLVRFKVGISRFDFSAIAMERQSSYTDFRSFITNDLKKRMFGGDIVGEFLGLGIWGEYAYNDLENSDDFDEMIFGADYTFHSGTHMLCEYYRNSQGESCKDDYNLNSVMRWLTAETRSLSQDQIFLYLNHPATDLLQVGGSVIACLNDASVVAVPTVIYSMFENLDLTLFGNIYVGEEGSNYSSELGSGGILRIRVYF